jgi:hypothetical protein
MKKVGAYTYEQVVDFYVQICREGKAASKGRGLVSNVEGRKKQDSFDKEQKIGRHDA